MVISSKHFFMIEINENLIAFPTAVPNVQSDHHCLVIRREHKFHNVRRASETYSMKPLSRNAIQSHSHARNESSGNMSSLLVDIEAFVTQKAKDACYDSIPPAVLYQNVVSSIVGPNTLLPDVYKTRLVQLIDYLRYKRSRMNDSPFGSIVTGMSRKLSLATDRLEQMLISTTTISSNDRFPLPTSDPRSNEILARINAINESAIESMLTIYSNKFRKLTIAMCCIVFLFSYRFIGYDQR